MTGDTIQLRPWTLQVMRYMKSFAIERNQNRAHYVMRMARCTGVRGTSLHVYVHVMHLRPVQQVVKPNAHALPRRTRRDTGNVRRTVMCTFQPFVPDTEVTWAVRCLCSCSHVALTPSTLVQCPVNSVSVVRTRIAKPS